MKRAHKNENDVKADVKELLNKYGWFHWPNSAGPFSAPGLEDRSALKGGVYMAVESKFKRDQTTLQKERQNNVIAAGGYYFVVDETGIESFEIWLKAIDANIELGRP